MGTAAARVALCSFLAAAAGAAAQTQVMVFPTLPHAASNNFPFNMSPGTTMHQVYASSLFANAGGNQPVAISKVAWAPMSTTTFSGHVVIRYGYTNAIPGAAATAGGLQVPDINGGGAPNAVGTMTEFFSGTVLFTPVGPASENFSFEFEGTSFTYDPSQGNLLEEIYITNLSGGPTISRCGGGLEGSRAYHRHDSTSGALPTQAHRAQFTFEVVGGQCYANCDGSTLEPVLNVADFGCFLTKFAAGDAYANCDQSTLEPVLNVADFGCFLTKFAAGCP